MALQVVQLYDMLQSGRREEEIKQILLSFCSLRIGDKIHDVEDFLHNKAIQFEKNDIARTYLVFSSYRGSPVLVGYYSLSNKPLIISRKNFCRFSTSLKKRLLGLGHKTQRENYEIKGYLLGQLGKKLRKQCFSNKSHNRK